MKLMSLGTKLLLSNSFEKGANRFLRHPQHVAFSSSICCDKGLDIWQLCLL